MKTPPTLTPRLKKIADLVKPCQTVADIGTDHAYLPVFLVMNGRCRSAIASDICQGPLDRAAATIEKYGQNHLVKVRLGSGVNTLVLNEADTIIIAGMGGLIISEILKSRPEIFSNAKQIIVQPMSSVSELREILFDIGYTIENEYLAKEDRKLYNIFSLKPIKADNPPTEVDIFIGKALIETMPEHFSEYLEKRKKKLRNIIEGLKKSSAENSIEKLKKASNLMEAIEKIEVL